MLPRATLRQELRAAGRGLEAGVAALHCLLLCLSGLFTVASDLVMRHPLSVAEPLAATSVVALHGQVLALPLLGLLQERLRRLSRRPTVDAFLV